MTEAKESAALTRLAEQVERGKINASTLEFEVPDFWDNYMQNEADRVADFLRRLAEIARVKAQAT